jgi:hypothetical protein
MLGSRVDGTTVHGCGRVCGHVGMDEGVESRRKARTEMPFVDPPVINVTPIHGGVAASSTTWKQQCLAGSATHTAAVRLRAVHC